MTTLAAPPCGARRPEAARATVWARVLATLGVLTVLGLVIDTRGGTVADSWGRPLATDFSSFWTAGRLAEAGTPEAVWDRVAHADAQSVGFPARDGFAADEYPFFYPPPFLLLCLPLALLPYGVAVAVWVVSTGAAYLAAIRAMLPTTWPATLVALAFPAVLVNAEHGQNGALSAALLGFAALQLDRRPRVAGVCLGLLCCKPQLGLLVVPALLAAGRLRALAWAALAVGIASLAAWLAFGDAAWRGFLAGSAFARLVLEAGLAGFPRMDSSFAAARLLGAGLAAAWAVQVAVSVAALAVLVAAGWRRPGASAEVAALAAAACLASPYLLDYDLAVLAVPLAWLASGAAADGFLPGERPVLAAAFMLPMVARPIALQLGLPVAPLVVAALLACVVRRTRATPMVPGARR